MKSEKYGDSLTKKHTLMKTKLLTLSFCLLSANIFAEQYFPKNSQWKVFSYDISTCCIPQYGFFDYLSEVVGDTIIEGKEYQIINHYDWNWPNHKMFIREADNKLFGWQSCDVKALQKERVVADFSLQVGDSLLSLKWNEATKQVDSVYSHVIKTDKVKLNDGRYAKRIFFDNKPAIVEYVGCEGRPCDLFTVLPDFGCEYQMVAGCCFLIDDKPIYSIVLQPEFYKEIQPFYCGNQYFPEGSKWEYGDYIRTTCMDPNCAYEVYNSSVYYVGDTTINDIVYSNLKYYSLELNYDSTIFLQDFFIRYEDNRLYGFSSNDIPFLEYDNNNSQDYLLADFNLEVGDSMFLKYQNRYTHVVKTDSVYMKDGTALKRITFDYCQPIVEKIISEENMMFLFMCNNMITDLPYHTEYAVTMCYEQLVGGDEVIAYSNINKPDIFYYGYNDVIRSSYCDNSYYPLYGGTWHVLNIDQEGRNIGTTRYETKGDTVINNIKYQKLERNGQLYAAIRDDAPNGKWYVSPDFEHEYLMYDFSVKQGDYVDVLLDIESSGGKLTKCIVNSVEEINGRRRIGLLGINENEGLLSATKIETWIEGIGSLAGIGNSNLLRTDNMLDSLLCFTTHRSNNQEYYATINGKTCDDIVKGLPITNDTDADIIVNGNILNVDIPANQSVKEIMVYNVQGKQVLSTSKEQADISTLSSGLYLVVVKTNKSIWSDKFVVK